MKALILSGIVVLGAAHVCAQRSSVPAGAERSPIAALESYERCDLQKLEKNLCICLSQDVEGIVMNALREVAKIKLAQPDCSSDVIETKVQNLVRTGMTPAVRFKAYLTTVVLQSPHSFFAEGKATFQTDEEFFTALARRLEGLALSDMRTN